MSKVQIDSVRLGEAISQVHDLPSDAVLLDVRDIEAFPTLFFAHDPAQDGVGPREIWALLPGGSDVDTPHLDDMRPIAADSLVHNGRRYFENVGEPVHSEEPAADTAAEGDTAAAGGEGGGDSASPTEGADAGGGDGSETGGEDGGGDATAGSDPAAGGGDPAAGTTPPTT